MSHELTQEQREKYLKHGGVRCPFCESDNIVGDSMEIHAGKATQEVGCNDCGQWWVDLYTLTDIAPQA